MNRLVEGKVAKLGGVVCDLTCCLGWYRIAATMYVQWLLRRCSPLPMP